MPVRNLSLALIIGCSLVVGVVVPAQAGHAATLCVNQRPASSCFRTVGAALAKAVNGATISVAAGSYAESESEVGQWGVETDRPHITDRRLFGFPRRLIGLRLA